MGMTWRFDAWAVRDGVAFVSDRDELGEDPNEWTARSTVFMSVPDLEPVPVGRLSTALRATRGSFQEGFRDAEGEEFVFEDLDQVRQVVRCVYLTSSIGEDGALQVGLPLPHPPDDDTSGGAAAPVPLATHFMEKAIGRFSELDPSQDLLSERESREKLLGLSLSASREVAHMVRGYALDVSRSWEARAAWADERDRDLLASWYLLHWQLGTWDTDEFAGEMDLDAFAVGRQTLGGLVGSEDHLTRRIAPGAVLRPASEILATAPAALRGTWCRGFRRLSDKLALAIGTTNYFEANSKLPELAPSLLCALLLSGDTRSALHEPGRFEKRIAKALRWLWREVPAPDSIPDGAREVVNDYGWSSLSEAESRSQDSAEPQEAASAMNRRGVDPRESDLDDAREEQLVRHQRLDLRANTSG